MSRPIFDHLESIRNLLNPSTFLLLGTDFDGTLTPLMNSPDEARLSARSHQVVTELSRSPGTSLAIISGRMRHDLHDRIGIPNLIYAGNHGLEISGPGFFFIERAAAEWGEELREFSEMLTSKLEHIQGAIVEDKGLTISIHYRMVDEAQVDELKRIVHQSLAGAHHPYYLGSGKKVFEVRPRVYWNKGSAFRWIRERMPSTDGLTIYMGDDTTDEDVFVNHKDAITIKVGDPAATAAEYHVPDSNGAIDFLEWLLSAKKSPGSRKGLDHARE